MLIHSSRLDHTPKSRVTAIFVSLFIVGIALLVSRMLGTDETLAIYVVSGVIVFFFAFFNTDFALVVLLLSMLLSPEFAVGGAGGSGQMSQRNVVIRIDDILLAIITVSWLIKSAINKELGVFIKTPLNRPIFIYLVMSLFATVLGIFLGSVRPMIGLLYNIKYFQYFMIYFMVSSHVKDLKTLKRYMFFLVFTGIIVSIYAISQIPSGARVSAPFEGESGEANTLGGYLAFIMSILIGVLSEERKVGRMAAILGIIGLMFVPFLYTLSRSSWISMVPAIMVLLLLSPNRVQILRFAVPVIIIIPFFLPAAVYERFEYTFSEENELRNDVVEMGQTALDPSTSARITSWSSTIEQWMERPVFGWGVTGAGFKDAQYFRVLAETGAFGFFLFMYLLYSVHKITYGSMKRLDIKKYPYAFGFTLGYYCGYWALLVHAIGANTFIIVRIMEPFWFVTALIVMLPGLLEQREQEQLELASEKEKEDLEVLTA